MKQSRRLENNKIFLRLPKRTEARKRLQRRSERDGAGSQSLSQNIGKLI